jgi:hypothetical protein
MIAVASTSVVGWADIKIGVIVATLAHPLSRAIEIQRPTTSGSEA